MNNSLHKYEETTHKCKETGFLITLFIQMQVNNYILILAPNTLSQ